MKCGCLFCVLIIASAHRSEAAVAENAPPAPQSASPPPAARAVALAGPRSTKIVQMVLLRRVAPKFHETHLKEVVQWFSMELGLEIYLDDAAIVDEGIDPDARVNFASPGMRARTALDVILNPLGLVRVSRQGYLLITTGIEADALHESRVYDVGDLIAPQEAVASPHQGYQSLVEFVKRMSVGVWSFADGNAGTVTPMNTGGIQALVIRQTERGHEEIERLFAGLRAVREPEEHPLHDPQPQDEAGGTEQMPSVLQQHVTEDFRNTPVREVVASLERQLGVALVIDEQAISDEGIDLDVTVDFSGGERRAAEAVRRLLEPFGFTIVLENDFVLITSEAKASEGIESRVYDIADLVPVRAGKNGTMTRNVQPILNAIELCCEQGLVDRGLSEGVVPVAALGICALGIRCSRKVHRDIEVLLERIRSASIAPKNRPLRHDLNPLP